MKNTILLYAILILSLQLVLQNKAKSQTCEVKNAVKFDVSIPLRDMKPAKIHFWERWKRENDMEVPNKFRPVPPGFTPDGALQKVYNNGSKATTVAPIVNFNGTTNASNAGRVTPPDPTGDVGPNHYVQVVNSELQIFNKTGTSLYGPVMTSTLWNGFSGNWTGHNNGDAIVLYDENADRWLICQFAIDCTGTPYTEYEMVAISTTGDPTGSYYRYAFLFDYMPDYPKLGVWQDGYYMAVNRFNTNSGSTPFIGVGACVLERSKMLTGDASARMIYFKTETLGGSGSGAGSSCWAMMPSDCDGTFPATGTPNYFAYINGSSELRLWALHTDWTVTTNSTFNYVTALPVASYTQMGSGSVPEQGTLSLDAIGDRLMFRNQYRNFGSYETFVTCHSVNSGSGVAGIRWYEYRKTGPTFSLYQQSTYAPGDGKSRWMGSIAMNASGDIGLAYSVSSSTMYPSIYFTGRKAADPLNQMTFAEGLIQTGTVSMTTYSRWGDYSAINIDPSDNTTFWTTQEYVGTYGGWCPWATKIASFKFANNPSITTFAATAVTATTATLNGTVNPNGLSTTYHFEYGTTTSYGTNTTTTSAGSGSSTLVVNANITGLATGIPIHFRLVATNSDGTSYGSDLAFTPATPTLTVIPSDRPVAAASGTTSFTVTSNSNWAVSSDQSWCTVTPSGTGNGTITATYTQNTTTSSRVAHVTVTVTGLTPIVATVTQAAPTLSVTPSNQSVSAAYGTTPFTVTSNSAWTVSSNQSWCIATLSGTGNGTITATYAANTIIYSRVANITVTVSGLTPVVVTVTQAAAAPSLSVTPTNRPVTPPSGNTSFAVTSNIDWIASSDKDWCIVTPSGSGSGTITATYSQNTIASSRVASITVTGTGVAPVVVTVTQAAPALSVTPSDQAVTFIPGNVSFTLTSNANWTASSDQTWCTVTPSGTGNGSITATYTGNSAYSTRVANVTVNVPGLSPVVVTVTQTGAEFNYTIANDVQISDRKLEFDLYLLNIQPSTPFELSIIQSGILINSEILNGGTITASIVSGYSDLVQPQQPTIATWVDGTPNGCIKIAGKTGPGCGSGTIISTTGLGTRICRVRITNSVPFAGGSQADLTFNFTISPYPTKVFRYSGTPCSGHELTTNSTNCFSLAANPVLNGPPLLSVSPSDQLVTSSAGTVPFTVTTNSNWTASSNQSWCTVTSSGFGNGTITATYTGNSSSSPRVANVTVTVAGLTPVVVTVSQDGVSPKTLNLTVFLEGLYIGNSLMHPVMDEYGYHWGATVADKLTIELHDGSNYPNIVYTATNVQLNTNGSATFTAPSSYNGNYYVTIRHRNHILTTSALPVSFSFSTINYNFDAPGKAYGNNMIMMFDGKYVLYAGDVTHDGLVDGSDLNQIGNQNESFAIGYLVEDINGDGLVDGSDLNITSNNNEMFVASVTP